jgi:hypothetical protein
MAKQTGMILILLGPLLGSSTAAAAGSQEAFPWGLGPSLSRSISTAPNSTRCPVASMIIMNLRPGGKQPEMHGGFIHENDCPLQSMSCLPIAKGMQKILMERVNGDRPTSGGLHALGPNGGCCARKILFAEKHSWTKVPSPGEG